MKHTLFAGLLIVAFAALVLADAPATQPAAPPAVGEAARDFTLNQIDGKSIQLSELTKQGPVVLLMLRGWVGYQCPICTRQVGDFIANADKLKAAGAQVVLVYPGAKDLVQGKAEEFVAGKSLPEGFHFLIDPDLKVVNQYNLRWNAPNETAYPSTFVFDKNGIVRFSKISHSHGDRSSADDVEQTLSKIKE